MDSNPPLLAGDLPGKPVGSLTAQDVCVMHLAGISFSRGCMVCEPTLDKVLKLADGIMTDGFVTDTEPLLLNATRPRWRTRAFGAFRRGVRWLMGSHLSARSVCVTTSPRPALSHCICLWTCTSRSLYGPGTIHRHWVIALVA